MKSIKKKIYITAAVLAATAPALIGVPALADPITNSDTVASSGQEATVKLIIASLSIRDIPDASGERLGVISRNTPAVVTGNVEGKYTEIFHEGITGWVETRFVKDYEGEAPQLPQPEEPIEETSETVQIIASLSIREKADSTSTRLGVVPRLSIAKTTGKTEGSYSEITYNGITGWVETRFVKDYEGELPEEPTTPEPETPEPETPETGTKETVQIIASLSIRENADSTSTRLGVVPRLSIAKTTGEVEGKYSRIVYEDLTGWVETRFVKDYEGELPEEPTTPTPEPETPIEDTTDARRTVTASISLFKTGEANERIAGVVRNTNVTVTGKTYGKYTEVSVDGLIGWVESRFVKEYDAEFDVTPSEDLNPSDKGSVAELGKQEVRSPNAYFYQKADAKSLVVAKLPKYSVVEVLEIDGPWAKAKLENGKEGYVVVTHLGEYVADTYSKWKLSTDRMIHIYDTNESGRTKITSETAGRPIEVLETKGTWTKVRIYDGTSTRITDGTVGWTQTSKLKNFNPSEVTSNAYYQPASERVQRQWTDALPSVCKDTTIAQVDIKNTDKTGASYIFSTKVDSEGGNFFIITIDGNIDPFSETGQAIMKHECGHVLMTKYDQEHGRTAWRAFLDRGWPNREASRVENLADCIADELGATRGGVGYGTRCTDAQKQLAKELVDMYAPDARENS